MITIDRTKYKDPQDLYNKHFNNHCILLGGGSTIRDYINAGLDTYKLIKDEYTIGINKSYILGTSTYHTCMDLQYWIKDRSNLSKLATNLLLPQSICTKELLTNAYILKSKGKSSNPIPFNFNDGIYYGKSSGYIAIVCAYLMGFNPIYLLGFDLCGGHFHEGYGIEQDNRLNIDHKVIKDSMVEGIEVLLTRSVSIISLSAISKLNTLVPYNFDILNKYFK